MGTSVVTLFSPSHIHYAKYGRPPGKPAPINEILKWVKDKGIIFPKKKQLGTAFAISRAIGKHGTLNYVEGAPNALEEAILKHNQKYLAELNGAVNLTIKNSVDTIYKDMFPEKVVFKF